MGILEEGARGVRVVGQEVAPLLHSCTRGGAAHVRKAQTQIHAQTQVIRSLNQDNLKEGQTKTENIH